MNNKREVQSEKQVRISSKVLKKTTLNKVKEKARIKLTLKESMLSSSELNITIFLESLILAQDERWRRA